MENFPTIVSGLWALTTISKLSMFLGDLANLLLWTVANSCIPNNKRLYLELCWRYKTLNGTHLKKMRTIITSCNFIGTVPENIKFSICEI